MAGKYENRIDYIDISAYGIGKVKVDVMNGSKSQESEKDINDETINGWAT